MKRLISFLLVSALLLGCLPAVPVFAASGIISVEEIEVMEGSDTEVELNVNLSDNPGICYVKLAVVYDSEKLCKGDDESAFANTIFSADYGSVGSERISTHRDITNYIPDEVTGTPKGFIVEVETEDWSNVYDDGIVVSLPLSLVDPVVGEDYTVYVSVVEATDENGDEMIEAGTMVTGKVSIKADELLNAYESFTIFTSPENSTIPYGTESFDVDVRICQNPGIWAARFYVVYPDSLSLDNGSGSLNGENSGKIFTSLADFTPGIPDLDLDDSKQVAAFKKIVEDKGLTIEGYKSSTLYFQDSSSVDEVVMGNGVLATLHFTVLESARIGDILDIKIYYAENEDFLWAGTSEDGMPVFKNYNPATVGSSIVVTNGDACGHINVTTDRLEATCTEDGYEKTVCNDCGYVTVEKAIPATGHSFALGICTNCGEKDASIPGTGEGFTVYIDPAKAEIDTNTDSISLDVCLKNNPGVWAVRVYIVYPDCLTLDDGTGKADVTASDDIFHTNDLTLGLVDLALDDNRIISTFEKVIAEKGIQVEGYSSTTLYFENSTAYDESLTGNGVLATLNFKVKDELLAGDVLDIKIYYGEDEDFLSADTDSSGYPIFETFNPASLGAEIVVASSGEEACKHTNVQQHYYYPTCTEDGRIFNICTECGETVSEEIISAPGHDENGDLIHTTATCLAPGKIEYTCSICRAVVRTEIIPQTEHIYSGGACITCGKIEETETSFKVYMSPENGTISASPDDSISVDIIFENNPGIWSARMLIVYPDALSLKDSLGNVEIYNSYYLYYGEDDMICGVVDLPLGDSRLIGEYQELIARMGMPTEGYSCTILYFEPQEYDRITYNDGVLANLKFHPTENAAEGGTYGVDIFYTENDFLYASLMADGSVEYKYYTPSTRGTTVFIAACDHFNTYETTSEPGCTEDGYYKVICSDCKAVLYEEIYPANGHDYTVHGWTNIYEPSCTEGGYTEKYCGFCGEIVIENEVTPLGHDENGTVEYDPPTCTELGHRVTHCSRCGEVVKQEELDSLGHTPGAEATCETAQICIVCGEELVAALGHNFVGGVCENCGISESTDPYLDVDSIDIMEGTATGADLAVELYNNTGIYYVKLAVVYDSAKLIKGDDEYAFASSIFGADYGSISSERSATHRDIRDYIPEGVEGTFKGFTVEVETEDGLDVYDDGIIAELPLDFVDPVTGDTYTVYVSVVEAYDELGKEVIAAGTMYTGEISYSEDPLNGVYDEFTVFTDPSEIEIGSDTEGFGVNIRLNDNPGLWASRIYIVYPDYLSLDNGSGSAACTNPGRIFGESDMYCGVPDLALDDPRLISTFKNLIVEQGITVEGYSSFTLYFQNEKAVDQVLYGNGILATLYFTVVGEITADDRDIKIYYGPDEDFLWAGTDAETGAPLFKTFNPQAIGADLVFVEGCKHENIYAEKVEPTCTEGGSVTHFCADCGEIIYEEYIEPIDHVYETVVVNATCTENGYKESLCVFCGKVEYREEILAPGHLYLQPQNSVVTPPTCTEEGFTTRYCDVCAEPKITDITPAWGHEEGMKEVIEGDCMTPGIEITYCDYCGEIMAQTEIIGSHSIVYYEAIEATCHQTGRQEFWMCEICQMVWADENLRYQTNINNLVIPAMYDLVYVEGYEASCHQTGMGDYWYCPECDAVFADAAGIRLTNRKNLVIPALNDLVYVEAVDATCVDNGHYEYWYCPDCDAVFADAAGIILTNRKNITIPAYGHNFVDYVCTNCGEIDPNLPPETPPEETYVLGDLDGDGIVSSKDINITKKLLSGAVVPTALQRKAGDVNGDGVFNGLDGNLLTKIAAGKI
ncbi:MAG: dockerin type I repeat-containing protein [Clostridia bacterium]|nr:dockerin type I repeat-containing protein [Clostridia bacterium]